MSALQPHSTFVKSVLAGENSAEQKEGRQRLAPAAKKRLESRKNKGMRIETTRKGFNPYSGPVLKIAVSNTYSPQLGHYRLKVLLDGGAAVVVQ